MRLNQYVVVLDACVLIPMPVADTLLRLAEEPEFYSPRWSEQILDEVERNLIEKFSIPPDKAARRVRTMKEWFPEAIVEGYKELVAVAQNHPKDRHVLAAAIRCGANAIVSNNKSHFPADRLQPYGLECLTADEFIQHQYHLDPLHRETHRTSVGHRMEPPPVDLEARTFACCPNRHPSSEELTPPAA